MQVAAWRKTRNTPVQQISGDRITRYLVGDLCLAPDTANAITSDWRTLRRVLNFRAPGPFVRAL